ncbi:MAG: M15 family metallopeptidase [Candidatus Moraniibacteriota bacterium]
MLTKVKPRESPIIVGSRMHRVKALRNNPAFLCPIDILACQELVTLPYYSFDRRVHEGQLVVHEDIAVSVIKIFLDLFDRCFPIARMIPIVHFQWDDSASMQANNTSGFNYRYIAGTERLSQHAFGLAIDLNPMQNPYIVGELAHPKGAKYDQQAPGTVTPEIIRIFRYHGFTWGGNFKDSRDYHHFQKALRG